MTVLNGLNNPQRAAVTAQSGPVLVLAGPGSGKTRVLTHRIAYLINEVGVPPWHIMSVTFTNKAAREMKERVESLIGEQPRGLTMGTFHSTCARLLRRESDQLIGYTSNFVIFDTDDQKQVVKQTLADLNLDDKRFPVAKMLSGISNAKNELITPDIYAATNYIAEVTRRVYTRYQELLIANDAMDFDDLLLNTVLLLDERDDILARYQERYHYLLVDEFQDTNTAQYSLLTRLAARHRNIFVVGDADQSIYKWRGADFRNINRFRQEYPTAETILLEENYRSTQTILEAAKAVIRKNRDRVDKDLFTQRTGGGKIEIVEAYNETEEGQNIIANIHRMENNGVKLGDVAVMYRTNAQSRAIEEAFIRSGMKYRLVGATRFYSRREIKDLVAYLRLVHNLNDSVSFARVINTPTRGIGKKSQDRLKAWAMLHEWQPGVALIKLATDPDVQHPFTGRSLNALKSFGEMLAAWVKLKRVASVHDVLRSIVDGVDFRAYTESLKKDPRDDDNRWQNIEEFLNVASDDEEVELADFLEQVALVSDVDDLEEGQEAPTLLTLHAAKGLEFPIVFITGLEEGILPHSRALDDAEELAEERRLFYVGLTRAKDRVYLSHAFRRTTYGMSEVAVPSRFLNDLPEELLLGGTVSARRHQSKARASQWSSSSSGTRRPTSRKGSQGFDDGWRKNRDDDDFNQDWNSSLNNEWSSKPQKARGKSTPKGEISGRRRSSSSSSSPRRQSDARRAYDPVTRPHQPTPADPEPVEQAPAVNYHTGLKVRHGKFGDGIVLETKDTGADTEITIAFGTVGIKRLAASFAKLEVLE